MGVSWGGGRRGREWARAGVNRGERRALIPPLLPPVPPPPAIHLKAFAHAVSSPWNALPHTLMTPPSPAQVFAYMSPAGEACPPSLKLQPHPQTHASPLPSFPGSRSSGDCNLIWAFRLCVSSTSHLPEGRALCLSLQRRALSARHTVSAHYGAVELMKGRAPAIPGADILSPALGNPRPRPPQLTPRS